ncbi:hypothetical protein J3R30DRAFT_2100155 [Lentinula aciculospora]|uniref:Uncharacterized protein n=1 Tax=Lentinula aciculospora TaxID=153920 RepID=A0A9W9AHS5_9AGAR|nr:hypothetical protein J3R30DRAFT_2100155 [Lentinula aciculospora]
MPKLPQPTGFEIDHSTSLPGCNEKTNSFLRPNSPEVPRRNTPCIPVSVQRTSLRLEDSDVGGHEKPWSRAEKNQIEHRLQNHHFPEQRSNWDGGSRRSQIPPNTTIGYLQPAFTSLGFLPPSDSQLQETSDANNDSIKWIEDQDASPTGSSGQERIQPKPIKPHTWNYPSDNRESLALSARAIENTWRLAAMYSDSYGASKMIMPP